MTVAKLHMVVADHCCDFAETLKAQFTDQVHAHHYVDRELQEIRPYQGL